MAIGDNIRIIRTDKKLTQQQLANQMGISRSYLSDIENDRKSPSVNTVESLAEKLNISVHYLMTGEKAFSDMPVKERDEIFDRHFGTAEKNFKSYLKKVFDYINIDELSMGEAFYLTSAFEFLRYSDIDDAIELGVIIGRMNKIHKIKESVVDVRTDEEMKVFINNVVDHVKELIEEIYFGKVE